ncbi:MAG: tetratricopeptide repeat protein [Myxococcales bacterium]|nr:tetratricopeptide repeat protein [Myxococcales bacterium]
MAERSGKLPGKPPPVPTKRKTTTSGRPIPPPPPKAEANGSTEPDLDDASITRRLTNAGAAATIEALRANLEAELEALVSAGKEPKNIAGVALRLALIARDCSNDEAAVLDYCEQAGQHPLAIEILLSLAKGASDSTEFEKITEVLDRSTSAAGTDAVARVRETKANAWLYRFASPDRAAEVASEGFDATPTAELSSAHAMALAMQADWSGLERFYAESEDPEAACRAAQIATDCTNDLEGARSMLEGKTGKSAPNAHYASILEAQILAQIDAPAAERSVALASRVEMLAAKAPKSVELSATRFCHALAQEQAGEEQEAQATFAGLTSKTGWSTSVAQLSALRVASHRCDWAEVANQFGKLATLAKEDGLEVAYRRRRAEVVEHCLKNEGEALRAWKRLANRAPTDGSIVLPLLRLQMRAPKHLTAQLIAIATANRRDEVIYLRRAAAVAESQLEDVEQACTLSQRAADSSKVTGDLHDLARLRAKQDKSHAIACIYREIASMEADERVAVPLLQVGSLLELSAGREQQSMELVAEAEKRAPEDLATQFLLAAMRSELGKNDELCTSLEAIVKLTASEETRFATLCELGRAQQRANNSAAAREALSQASKLRPDDATLLLALADLCLANEEWDEAISLKERAVGFLPDGPETSLILESVGGIHEEKRSDSTSALAAYERARTMNPKRAELLQCCRRLYRVMKRPGDELASLRAELKLTEEDSNKLPLFLKIAKVSVTVGEPVNTSIEAFQGALAIDPNHISALGGLHALAGKNERHEIVAKAFSTARETSHNLKILCNAYERLKDWTKLVSAQQSYTALLQNNSEKAAMAVKNSEIYETKLGDDKNAIVSLQAALEHDPSRSATYEALVRILEKQDRWEDVFTVVEAHLDSIPNVESTLARRVELLCKAAELRRDRLDKPSEAAESFEAVLVLDGSSAAALDGLAKLYKTLGRQSDLLRILELRQATDGGKALLKEIAELRGKTGDADGAIEAYFKAFGEDTSNRDVFTSLEKLCYSKQRWDDVVRLYGEAIASVEAGDTQAYRLGDLYSRRGQIQLQYAKDAGCAAESFAKVLEVEPSNDKAMVALQEIYSESQDWPALIAAYESRATNARDAGLKVESLRQAAEIARSQLQDRAEISRLYQALSELDPDDQKANETLEEFYSETKDWHQLVKVLEARMAREQATGSVSTDLLKRLAKISEEGLRDDGRAVKYYEMLIELAPQNRRSLDALARIFESTERWTEFVKVTRRLVKVTKDRNVKALLYFKCGSVTEAKFGNEEDAIRYYDAAIKTSPACLPAVHGLRDLYLRREDWARVIQTLELEVKLWQDDKERGGVFAQIGRIYGDELTQPDRAMHYYESALAVDPECVPANRALFEHYFSAEEWERAQPLAQSLAPRAMREGDPTRRSEFYRKCGVVAAHTGDPVSAAESIVIALEIKPENIAALEALTELAAESPSVYDFPATFHELEKIYRKRGNSQELLARVMVGEAQVMTRAGNLHEAEALLRKAGENCQDDLTITEALVDLYESVRNWPQAIQVLEDFLSTGCSKETRLAVMIRQAQIHADGPMDAEQAVAVLRRILAIDPNNPEMHYLLAQELYCLERFADARRAIERVIELSAAPGSNISAERLARYYYYLGRILDRDGDVRGATAQYRRATDYDPGYAPPAQALAQHSMASGDARAAETRLVNSAHAAMEQGDRESAIQLQRELARIILKGGDRDAAIEAYCGILEVNDQGAADRLSLAEIYAGSDLHKAIDETRRVIEVDLRHGPAYRVLAGYYVLASEPARASRVLSTMSLLGYSEEEDLNMLQTAQSGARPMELNQQLGTELRATLLANESLASVVGELFASSYQQMSQIDRKASLGDNLTPLPSVDDHALHIAVGDMVRLFGMEPEVYVGENVPGRVIAIAHPRTIVVLDRLVLQEPEAARRFALGWAFEAICGGYSSVLNLGEKQRTELGNLLRSLFLPESERSSATSEFIKRLPPSAQEIIRVNEGYYQDFDMEEWMTGMNAVARRAGLLACDDLAACARMLAVISGENIGENYAALGTVFCGEDLFQFHISDEYDQLRTILNQIQ